MDKAQFFEIRDGITHGSKDAVLTEHEAIRLDGKIGLVQKLYTAYKDKYQSEIFNESNRQIDTELQENPIPKKNRSINKQLKAPDKNFHNQRNGKRNTNDNFQKRTLIFFNHIADIIHLFYACSILSIKSQSSDILLIT